MLKEPSQSGTNAMITHLSCCLSINTPSFAHSLSLSPSVIVSVMACKFVLLLDIEQKMKIFVIFQNTLGDGMLKLKANLNNSDR